jgi:hypothetical protein
MRPTAPLLLAALTLTLACRAGTFGTSPGAAASPADPGASALPAPSPADRAIAAAEVGPPPPLTGRVLETMDAGGYTYLKLDTTAGPAWAAIERANVAKGRQVTVQVSVAMDGFESPTLRRRFERIAFGTLDPGSTTSQPTPHHTAERPAKPAVVPGLAAVAAHHASGAAASPEGGPIKVDRAPAPEGRTVAEVFAQRAEIQGKPVAVRGKVVKFLPGIMGRNWLHLRDGSGTAEGKDHDLTVTTSETTAVGEVVVAHGTLRRDVDFGSGYAYVVLVEEAKLSR